jgi:hypothetical protein
MPDEARPRLQGSLRVGRPGRPGGPGGVKAVTGPGEAVTCGPVGPWPAMAGATAPAGRGRQAARAAGGLISLLWTQQHAGTRSIVRESPRNQDRLGDDSLRRRGAPEELAASPPPAGCWASTDDVAKIEWARAGFLEIERVINL